MFQQRFARHDFRNQPAPERDIAAAALGLPHFAAFVESVAERGAIVDGGLVRHYLLDLLRDGRFEIVSPVTNRSIRSGPSIVLADKSVLFAFPDEPDLMLGVGDISQGYPICALVVLSSALFLPLFDSIWGFEERHLTQVADVIRDTGWQLAPMEGPMVLVTGDSNFAHFAWNQLSAFDDLLRYELPQTVRVLATQQPIGPVLEILPELPRWPVQVVAEAMVPWQNRPGLCFVPVGASHITASLAERIGAHARRRMSEAARQIDVALAKAGPVLWMSVRTRNRTALNQHELLTALGQEFLAAMPTGKVLLDGYSRADDIETYPDYLQTEAKAVLDSDMEAATALREALEREAPGRVEVAVGLTVSDSIALSRRATAYFCHHGTVQHKIGWFNATPGVVHSNLAVLEQAPAEWTAGQSGVAVPPRYLPPRLVQDVRIDPSAGNEFSELLRVDNYTVVDIPAAVAIVMALVDAAIGAQEPQPDAPSDGSSSAVSRLRDAASIAFERDAGELDQAARYGLAARLGYGLDVLEVQCGAGSGARFLRRHARSVVGIELDDGLLATARTSPVVAGLRFRHGDPSALPVDDRSVDLVVSLGSLPEPVNAFLAELHRVLRPGGRVILFNDRLSRAEFEAELTHYFAHTAVLSEFAATVLLNDGAPRRVELVGEGGEAAQYLAIASDRALVATPDRVTLLQPVAVSPNTRTAAGLLQVRQLRNQVLASYAESRAAAHTALTLRQELGRVTDRAVQAKNGETEALAALRQAVAAREEAIAAQQAAFHSRDQAFAAIATMQASTLWRVMQPLRRVGRKAPGASRSLRKAAKLGWWAVTLQLGQRYRIRKQLALAKPPSIDLDPAPVSAARPVAIAEPPPALAVSPDLVPFVDPLRLHVSAAPVVSIVIATFGQPLLTLGCLRSLAAHPPAARLEVILVDDAAPETAELLALHALAEAAGVRLVRNESNLGFLRSCNAAATLARGDYLYLLNNDTELRAGAIDALVELLDTRPDAGLAGSKLIYPDGTLQEAGGIVWDDATAWNYGRGQDAARPEFNYVREVDYCSGASLLIRRALWDQLGGFDPAFVPAYYEDVDLAFRARAAGQVVLYEPRSVVVHLEGMSHGTDVAVGGKASQAVNEARMLDRWGPVLRAENYPHGRDIMRARDRSRHRKLILVVDHYALEADRDAGSRSTLGIVQSLLEAGWVVKFWPQNQAYSPIYTSIMERMGIEVIDQRRAEPFETYLRQNGRAFDHALVVRPEVAADVTGSLMRFTNAVLSFYGVDLHFARMRRQAALAHDGALMAEAATMERLERRLCQMFDVVIYPSNEEAIAVREMAPDVAAFGIVPFTFDVDPPRRAPAAERVLLFVAGFAHPPNVDAALVLVREILPLLEAEIGPIQLILAGSNPTDAVRDLAGPRVTVTGFITDEELAEFYVEARAAVVPLRFGAGVKGKVIEALSHGLPVVTTSIGAQGIEGLRDVVPVHDDPASISAALATIMRDDAVWLAQSHRQTAFANTYFSRAAMRASVLTALRSADPTIPT